MRNESAMLKLEVERVLKEPYSSMTLSFMEHRPEAAAMS
jgi:hypothetical protein